MLPHLLDSLSQSSEENITSWGELGNHLNLLLIVSLHPNELLTPNFSSHKFSELLHLSIFFSHSRRLFFRTHTLSSLTLSLSHSLFSHSHSLTLSLSLSLSLAVFPNLSLTILPCPYSQRPYCIVLIFQGALGFLRRSGDKRKPRTSLSRNVDISSPSDFKHLGHIGPSSGSNSVRAVSGTKYFIGDDDCVV